MEEGPQPESSDCAESDIWSSGSVLHDLSEKPRDAALLPNSSRRRNLGSRIADQSSDTLILDLEERDRLSSWV